MNDVIGGIVKRTVRAIADLVFRGGAPPRVNPVVDCRGRGAGSRSRPSRQGSGPVGVDVRMARTEACGSQVSKSSKSERLVDPVRQLRLENVLIHDEPDGSGHGPRRKSDCHIERRLCTSGQLKMF